jgi:PhnB protein
MKTRAAKWTAAKPAAGPPADAHPEVGACAPGTIGGSPVKLLPYGKDVDAVARQAIAAGARVARPVEDRFYGDRSGACADPFGHEWHVSTHIEDVSPAELRRRAAAEAAK